MPACLDIYDIYNMHIYTHHTHTAIQVQFV